MKNKKKFSHKGEGGEYKHFLKYLKGFLYYNTQFMNDEERAFLRTMLEKYERQEPQPTQMQLLIRKL